MQITEIGEPHGLPHCAQDRALVKTTEFIQRQIVRANQIFPIHSPQQLAGAAAAPFRVSTCKFKTLFTISRRFMMLSSSVAFFAFFTLLPAVTVAGNQHLGSHGAGKRDAHLYRADRILNRQNSRNFTLFDSAEGANFFDKWTFWDLPDPTHGTVNYLNKDDAFNLGLAYVRDDGVAIMKVDSTTTLQSGENRNSIRIQSAQSYGQGLFIVDVAQMPYGCAVWPAFWSNGDNWPAGGEIDIIEGTQNATSNQSTLHTLPGCNLDTSYQSSSSQPGSFSVFTGEVASTTCDASVDSNTGCGITNSDPSSYGFGLNSVGGAVYATLWDDDGIRIWHFQRTEVPQDITDQNPNPDTWGSPVAFFSTDSCPMSQFFTNQTFIFNIALCGDLASVPEIFNGAGCPGTCADWVADPTHFRQAMWKVNYFRVYQ